MQYHKAAGGVTHGGGGVGHGGQGLSHRQGLGSGHMYGSAENSNGTNNTSGSDDERYDKILSRAREYANGGMDGTGLISSQHQMPDRTVNVGNNNNNNNNNSNNNSPTQPSSTSSSYKTSHEDRRSRADVYRTTDTGVAATSDSHSSGSGSGSSESPGYAIYEEDGGVLMSGSQEDQRKYGVPLPVLPTLNRSNNTNTPPDPLKSRHTVRNSNEQENDETGVKHSSGIDNNVTIHAMLKDMHRHTFRDDTLIDDFDELEKLLITSQEIDDNDNAADVSTGSLPITGTGNSSDEIARLRGK